MTTDDFLGRLDATRPAGPLLWSARCPAHEDRNSSLSIRENEDGWTILKCHAGCTAEDVVAALHLRMADLFPERHEPVQRQRVHRPAPAPVTPSVVDSDVDRWSANLRRHEGLRDRLEALKGWTYDALCELDVGWDGRRLTLPVRDEERNLRGVVRYVPGGSPKTRADAGTPRELWPPPEEMPDGEPLLLVEGEPDAISAMSLGTNAVAVPGAATWSDSWPARFAYHNVVVMFDCDEPGRKAAARAAAELSAVTWVRRVDLDPKRSDGFDLGDLLLAQRERGQLETLSRRLKGLLEN